MMTEFEKRFIKARKAVISADFKMLNPMQREAVMATEGPLLILAGAGSGKTTVLINRIANLLKYGCAGDSEELPADADEEMLLALEKGGSDAQRYAALDRVEPWRILAITFTNKAADELKARLERVLGPDANDIWACTFHSACVRILRRYIDRLGYDKSFTIYDADDSRRVMTAVLKDLNIDDKRFTPKGVLDEIGRAKDALVGPKEYAESAGNDFRRERIARCYTEYQKRLRSANALDFDDIIFETVRLLETDAEARS